jgi:hypothetical protein
MPIKTLIQSTERFQKLSLLQQKILLRFESQILIQHGIELVKNIGMEKWLVQTNLSHNAKNIVIEISLKNKSNA